MQPSSTDIKSAFGMPAISFIGMQVYYDRNKDKENPLYKRDHSWFTRHPRQRRFVRPAMGSEFSQSDAHVEYLGKRISAPQLWVCVEQRFGGQDHFVIPVYRGAAFWGVDSFGYMLPDDANDDEGNYFADKLLFQMHQANGIMLDEVLRYASIVAEIACVSAMTTSKQAN